MGVVTFIAVKNKAAAQNATQSQTQNQTGNATYSTDPYFNNGIINPPAAQQETGGAWG